MGGVSGLLRLPHAVLRGARAACCLWALDLCGQPGTPSTPRLGYSLAVLGPWQAWRGGLSGSSRQIPAGGCPEGACCPDFGIEMRVRGWLALKCLLRSEMSAVTPGLTLFPQSYGAGVTSSADRQGNRGSERGSQVPKIHSQGVVELEFEPRAGPLQSLCKLDSSRCTTSGFANKVDAQWPLAGGSRHAGPCCLPRPHMPTPALGGIVRAHLIDKDTEARRGGQSVARIWGSSQFCFQGSQGKPGVMGCPGSGPGVSRIPQPAVDEARSVRLCEGPLPCEGDDKRLISMSFPSVGSPRA